jgi:hypothetical protein
VLPSLGCNHVSAAFLEYPFYISWGCSLIVLKIDF